MMRRFLTTAVIVILLVSPAIAEENGKCVDGVGRIQDFVDARNAEFKKLNAMKGVSREDEEQQYRAYQKALNAFRRCIG